MAKVILKYAVIYCLFVQIVCYPALNPDCDTLYGVPVHDNLEEEHNFEEPKFLVPLIYESDGERPTLAPSEDEGDCNPMKHIGYANARAIKHELVPLDKFMSENCLPENVHFKIMNNAIPVFEPEKLCDKNKTANIP